MKRRGFTLVEVIIAALILSMAVGATLFVFSTEKNVVARTGRRFQAMEFGRQTLEHLKNEVSADTWPGASNDVFFVGTHTAATEGFLSLSGTDLDKFNPAREYMVSDVDVDGDGTYEYKQITISVEWDPR